MVPALLALMPATARADYEREDRPPLAATLPWYEVLELRGFVDGYASLNLNLPKPQTHVNGFRSYDTVNGFALSWVGVDAEYEPDPVGAKLALRLGPAANIHNSKCLSTDRFQAPCDADVGLTFVKEAFVTFSPFAPEGNLVVEFGKFDTIFGAEVADSQDNLNYTRGLLFTYGQPLFHTGFRVSSELQPELWLSALLVNGWNNSVDGNTGKSLGLKLSFSPMEGLATSLGWLAGPEQYDWVMVQCPVNTSFNERANQCTADAAATTAQTVRVDRGGANDLAAWRHLLDLTASFQPTERSALLLNATFVTEGLRGAVQPNGVVVEQVSFFGAMLAASQQLSSSWSLSARAEYFGDPNGRATGLVSAKLASATLTLGWFPEEYLSVRLENRGDFVLDAEPTRAVFQKGVRDTTDHQLTTTLGVVASTP